MPEIVHVVMASGIVFGAYRRPDLAYRHARCITGATVAAVDLGRVPDSLRALIEAEIMSDLPAEIVDDLTMEWNADSDDDTPQLVEVPINEIDDALTPTRGGVILPKAVTIDLDNPIITGTQMDLCYTAWILAAGQRLKLGVATLEHAGPLWEAFSVWWIGFEAGEWGERKFSLRESAWQAYVAGDPPIEPDHGAGHHFDRWWQTIIDSQPVA